MLSPVNVLSRLFRRRETGSASAARLEPRSEASSPTPFVERRRWPRRYGNPIQVLISDHRLTEESPKAWVQDRSEGGLGISSPQPFAVGINLGVRVANAPPGTPIVYVQVRGCTSRAGRWYLNCQFINAPPREVMLLFR